MDRREANGPRVLLGRQLASRAVFVKLPEAQTPVSNGRRHGAEASPVDFTEAYDLRYPGDLPPEHIYRLQVDVFMPVLDPTDTVALRLDGPMMLAWAQDIGEVTTEEALQTMERKGADYSAELTYGPSPPPDLGSDVARVTVPAGPAVKVELSWTDPEAGATDRLGYCIVADDTAYFVTFTFADVQAGEVLRDIALMVGSFHVE